MLNKFKKPFHSNQDCHRRDNFLSGPRTVCSNTRKKAEVNFQLKILYSYRRINQLVKYQRFRTFSSNFEMEPVQQMNVKKEKPKVFIDGKEYRDELNLKAFKKKEKKAKEVILAREKKPEGYYPEFFFLQTFHFLN